MSKNKISSTKISDIFEKSNLTKQWILDNSSLICRQHDSVDVPEHIKEKYVIGNIYEYISDSRKYYVSKDCENKISQRILLADKIFPCDDFYNTFGPSRIRGDWWSGFYLDMGNVSKEGNIDFPNGKKPVRLLKQLLKFSTKKDAIILDFFAGSGTTGHAVLELNLEDDGNRKFILCTNNESNICIERTYPRIKNVFNNYLDKEIGNLKYFKTDFVENTNNRDQLYYDLTEKCIPMLYLKEDCFELEKSTNEYKIFSNKNKNKFTCIYFDIFGEQEKEFTDYLKGIKEEKIIYKFSLGDYIDNEIFKNIENYSIEPIPYQIVELYRKLVKMSKEGIK